MKLYGSADVSCIQNMRALMFIPPVTNPPPPPSGHPPQNILDLDSLSESTKLNL